MGMRCKAIRQSILEASDERLGAIDNALIAEDLEVGFRDGGRERITGVSRP